MNQESWYETGLGWAVIGLVGIIILLGVIIYSQSKTITDCLASIDEANTTIQDTADSVDNIQTELANRSWTQMDSDVNKLESPQQVLPVRCVAPTD